MLVIQSGRAQITEDREILSQRHVADKDAGDCMVIATGLHNANIAARRAFVTGDVVGPFNLEMSVPFKPMILL